MKNQVNYLHYRQFAKLPKILISDSFLLMKFDFISTKVVAMIIMKNKG